MCAGTQGAWLLRLFEIIRLVCAPTETPLSVWRPEKIGWPVGRSKAQRERARFISAGS